MNSFRFFPRLHFYLGLPILTLGAMNFDVPTEQLQEYPLLSYNTGRRGEMLNIFNMARWCGFAFVQGLVIFTLCIRYVYM